MGSNRAKHSIAVLQKRQRGISVLLFLLVLSLFALSLIIVARVAPIYYEYFNVKSSLDGLHKESKSELANEKNVRLMLRRRFNVNDVKSVNPENIRVDYSDKQVTVKIQYEVRTPLVGNLSILANFSTRTEINL